MWHAYDVTYDDSTEVAWTNEHSLHDEDCQFNLCRAIDGVVVQERAGETTVLAVAYDVTVTSVRGTRELTFVVRVVG